MEKKRYPYVDGEEIVFNVSGSSSEVDEERRELQPVVLDDITEEEFKWLNEEAKGTVFVSTYQGDSRQHYELKRNPKTGQVALRWQGILVLDPVELIALHFYDGITNEVYRLQEALDLHREGLANGWGDEMISVYEEPKGV